VILDADETVLDNSTYQMRLARRGEAFSNETWNDWVREEAAGAQPGAGRFIELVRTLGGRVAVVTNRDEPVCDATRRNLTALGIEVDVVLCQAEGERGKEGRFAAVQQGTTPAGLPPLDVVMWVGDNIHDFPGLDQRVREGPPGPYELFGRRWFVLPNPMYGSWEGNPAG
jgi:acid phosphatase